MLLGINMVDGKFDPFMEQDGSEMEDYEDDDHVNMLGTLEYQSRIGNWIVDRYDFAWQLADFNCQAKFYYCQAKVYYCQAKFYYCQAKVYYCQAKSYFCQAKFYYGRIKC